jgi:short-subunit dehydrogenase
MTNSQNRLPRRPTPLHPGRRVILVGASSGIGAALARQLAAEGCSLALLARRSDLLEQVCAGINAAAGETRAIAYTHDVTDFDSVPGLLDRIVSDLGGLDLFIYNSGISIPSGMKHYEFEKDRLVTEVNYLGALAWLNPVASMFYNLRSGQIVGISSVAGERGRVGNPSYNASKAALSCYLESLRNRLTRRGVHVLTVKPGYVLTSMVDGVKHPLFAIPPERAAADICKAIRRRKQDIYTAPIWRLVMFTIRNIPSVLFRSSLRNRLTRRGVHVLTVKPGYVRTSMVDGVKHPLFVISPERAAADICKAIRRRKQDIYTAPIWRLVMFTIRNIPSVLFRRMTF